MTKKILFCLGLAASLMLVSCASAPRKPAQTQTVSAQDPFAIYTRGVMMLKKGEYSTAITFFREALRQEPTNGNYHNAMGLALINMGETDDAIVSFKKGLECNPELTDIHNTLGTIYIDKGQYKEALIELNKVIEDKTYPTPSFAYFNIGILKEKQGKVDEAIYAYEFALKLKPDFYRVYVKLAALYYVKEQFQDCYNAVVKAKKEYQDNPELLLLESKSNLKLGNYTEAERVLTKLKIMHPSEEIRKEMKILEKELMKKKWESNS